MAQYVPHAPQEQEDMLEFLGLSSLDELYNEIPRDLRLKEELKIHDGLSLMETEELFENLASGNMQPYIVLRGAGAYQHFIPPLCKRIPAKESFLTAYTPYQAECSQGVLQSIFEFQTMICELTGMDLANASMYSAGQALAEACMMCADKKRSKILVAESVNPEYLSTLKTYAHGKNLELEVIPCEEGSLKLEALGEALKSEGISSMVLQQPNYWGNLEDAEEVGKLVREAGARFVMCVNPIAQAVLKTPKECGAHLVVGEGQPLGMPLSFGGPYLGFMAADASLMRKMPGRIVGETQDAEGNRAFVLTLQTREQHIRREKSGSNICTNQALCALTAGVYMACMGSQGIQDAAAHSYKNAHDFAQRLCSYEGFELVFEGSQEFFHEFVTTAPEWYAELESHLLSHRILPGLRIDKGVLWCATELFTPQKQAEFFAELDSFYALRKQMEEAKSADLPDMDEFMKLFAGAAPAAEDATQEKEGC